MALFNLYGWTKQANVGDGIAAACGSSCGSGDKTMPTACGSSCGSGDKVVSAACGSGDK